MAREEGEPVLTDFEKRRRLIEPRFYDLNDSLNKQAAETVAKLREVLKTKSGIVELTLHVDKPPYFKMERAPDSLDFRAEMAYFEQEGSRVSFHRERVELVSWIELNEKQDFMQAARSNRLESVSFRVDTSHIAAKIWTHTSTGGIYLEPAQITGWEEKEEFNYPRQPGEKKAVPREKWERNAPFGHCPACGSKGMEDVPCREADYIIFNCSDRDCLTVHLDMTDSSGEDVGVKCAYHTIWIDEKPCD